MPRTTGLRSLLVTFLALLALAPEAAAPASPKPRSGRAAKAQKARPAPERPTGAAASPTTESTARDERAASAAASEVTALKLAFDVTSGRPGARVQLTVRMTDPGGRAREAPLQVQADAGVVGAPARASAGTYTATITLPTSLGTRRSLIVIASAGQAVASISLPLAAGPAAALSVEAPPDLPADGANHPLWIGVTDAHGNPSDEPPRVTVTRGELGEPEPIAAGEWMIDYHPPRSSWVGGEAVSVSAGAASTTRPLALTPVPALLTVAPRTGVVLGAGGPAFALGAEAGIWVMNLPPSLGLVLDVLWWGADDTRGVAGPAGALDLRTRRSWLPLTLSAAARQPLGRRATLTVTAGGGTALVTSKASLPGQPSITESGWAPAAMAGVDLAFRTRLGAPFAGVRGAWIGDPKLDTVRGSAWPVMLLVGARFDAY